tara:strand:+ start:4198 stop:4449 length:252 start_codon:yes stop_codon:yes gene_type:complete
MDSKDNSDSSQHNNPIKTLQNQGGKHYQGFVIQPAEFIIKNNLPFAEGNVVKYTLRHNKKNGAEDIKKAIHYLKMILEMQYGE